MSRFLLFLSLFAGHQSVAQEPVQKPEQTHEPAANSGQAGATAAEMSPEVAASEAAMAKSDWKTAETNLTSWLAKHPTDARALFDAGYTADAQNRDSEAEGLYRRAIDANPKSFEAHLSLGLLLARQAKPYEARPELVAASQLDPGEAGPLMKPRAWRALAKIDRQSDPKQASIDLLEALKISPETASDTLLAAGIAEESNDYAAAEKAYRRVLANDPKSAAANAGLAHVLMERKQYPEAETRLRTALEQAPDDPVLSAELATVLAAQDKAEALPLLQKLSTAHPNDPAISRMLAAVLADAGDYSGSDHLYTSLLVAAPNDATLLIGHGQNMIRMMRYQDAFAAFTKAAEADPGNSDAWSGLAFAASRSNRPEITLHALTMRSKYLKEVPSTYFLWATAYDSLHRNGLAADYYRLFLESSAGKFPDQEWQARQRLKLFNGKP